MGTAGLRRVGVQRMFTLPPPHARLQPAEPCARGRVAEGGNSGGSWLGSFVGVHVAQFATCMSRVLGQLCMDAFWLAPACSMGAGRQLEGSTGMHGLLYCGGGALGLRHPVPCNAPSFSPATSGFASVLPKQTSGAQPFHLLASA